MSTESSGRDVNVRLYQQDGEEGDRFRGRIIIVMNGAGNSSASKRCVRSLAALVASLSSVTFH